MIVKYVNHVYKIYIAKNVPKSCYDLLFPQIEYWIGGPNQNVKFVLKIRHHVHFIAARIQASWKCARFFLKNFLWVDRGIQGWVEGRIVSLLELSSVQASFHNIIFFSISIQRITNLFFGLLIQLGPLFSFLSTSIIIYLVSAISLYYFLYIR